ncbi:MAG TPA: hypothetical protein VKN99_24340 [Polyangia bacterium]|nr:hypothetical protein [Polyangia bacterium]
MERLAANRRGTLKRTAGTCPTAGPIGDDHVVAEIGQVLDGKPLRRTNRDEITIYKSIGHMVQDLATVWALHHEAEATSQRPAKRRPTARASMRPTYPTLAQFRVSTTYASSRSISPPCSRG